jgi:hypothetical protein
MNYVTGKKVAAFLVLALMVFTSVSFAEDFPEVTEDGLHKLSSTDHSVVYAKEDVDLSVYNKVYLVDVSVAFKKNWQREQNRTTTQRVSDKDMERIRTNLAELFQEVFAETLTEAGHELVSETGEDVVILRPAIINLDVNAPDLRSTGRTQTYVQSAGQMTLYVELFDSLTSDLLVKAIDAKADRESSFMQWQTKGLNKMAAERMLKDWAERLGSALGDANSVASASEE